MEGKRLGPYQVLAPLGSGGMGAVYRAEVVGEVPELDPGCPVALKVIHNHLLEAPGFFRRFLREADIGRSVRHDNVVRTYLADALLHEGVQQNFLVMEYVEGQTLRDLLVELERVPEELCRHIGREVAQGLAAIHAVGVLHRDLKPENVLITADHVVKVMDLGVARLQDEAVRLSRTGMFVGSLLYAAPEQFRSGGRDADARADLHALGAVLYELATGHHPFQDEDTPRVLRKILDERPRKAGSLNPQLSPFFEEVVHTLLEKDPEARFASAVDVARVLEHGEEGTWWRDRAQALRVETRRPLRAIRIPRETVVYGRDDDLARLRALYEDVKAGEGRVALIEGEAGIGKTRLVDEFVTRLQQDGEDVNFLFGSYPPGGAATAAGAFSTAYRGQFGAESLDDVLPRYLKLTPLLVPAFAALLKGDAPPGDAAPLTRDSLQTVFIQATRGLAAERPTVVLIDDLHFAPEDGRALFSALALAVPNHRILLVGTMRPGVSEAWTVEIERLEHASRSVLSRLGPKDLGKLLEDAFHSKHLAADLGWQIAQKSDGNPFFVFEIIQGLKAGQFIAKRPDGSWVTTQIIRDIPVPSSVVDLVKARVSGLEPKEREVLDVAACLGYTFDPALVADVAGIARIPLYKQLAQIERAHRLVRSSGRAFVFDHHQVQEALYGSLPAVLREEYHGALAKALERQQGAAAADPEGLDGALCVNLCDHYLRGDLGEEALRYLEPALAHLEAGYQNEQTLRLADRALGVAGLLGGARRARLLLRKAERLDILGRREEQAEALGEAIDLAVEIGDEALEVETRSARGGCLIRQAQAVAARADLERASELAAAIGDRGGESGAVVTLGLVHEDEGHTAEAQALYERALELARSVGHRTHEMYALGNLGNLALARGAFEPARQFFQGIHDVAQEVGDRVNQARGISCLGGVFHQEERLGPALEHYERALALDREIGFRPNESVTMVNMGGLLILLGDLDRATEVLTESRDLFRELQSPAQETFAEHGLGLAAESAGRTQEALDHYRTALERRRACGMQEHAVESMLSLGALLGAVGEVEEARAVLSEAESLAAEAGMTAYLVAARCYGAEVGAGDVDAAVRAFEEHGSELGVSVRMGLQFVLWKLTGDRSRLANARELLERVIEQVPEAHQTAAFENIPLHCEIESAWQALGPERAERVAGPDEGGRAS